MQVFYFLSKHTHEATSHGGKTVIDGLPAGAWIVQVEASDGQKWQGAAVTAGADAAVTVE